MSRSRSLSISLPLALGLVLPPACAAEGFNPGGDDDVADAASTRTGSILVDGGGEGGARPSGDASSSDAKTSLPHDAGKLDAAASSDASTLPPAGSPCNTSASQETSCGKCGTTSRACLDDGSGKKTWGAWGACLGETTDPDACDPSATYADEDCGNCGKRARICQLDCHFVSGLTCNEPTFGGEAACTPNTRDFLLGASCTGANEGRYRTCSASCQWSSPGPCEIYGLLANAQTVVVGAASACAIVAGGHVKCWGDGSYGQLGNGSAAAASTPVPVPSLTASALAMGAYHVCAVVGGGVSCWGHNTYGSLGAGAFAPSSSSSPIKVSGIAAALAISSGQYHTCAIVGAGDVKCWGNNSSGQVGDGTTTNAFSPVAVTGVSGATAIATGIVHSCAIVSGGAVKCWGNNAFGQLGAASIAGGLSTSPTPIDVTGISGAQSIVAGGYHTCVIVTGGGVKCWGYNDFGQLGDGTTTSSVSPVDVTGVSAAKALAGGSDHTCAIVSAAGEVECWGYNYSGQLGNGTNQSSPVAVMVNTVSGASSVSAGLGSTTCARATGGVSCWGYNHYGQLGNGGSSSSSVPLVVGGL
ncbi:MAG: hypothetical protein U0235_12760 [Polyangiaceae bacterium]